MGVVQVDKGNNVYRTVAAGEVLLEVAKVLGTDMSKWKQLVDDSARRRQSRGGGGSRAPR